VLKRDVKLQLTNSILRTSGHSLQDFATKPLKHLLGKNGVGSTPELEDDIRCEKFLNRLATQQKKSAVTENSSPPFKRQKLLGVNKNNEVIVVDDQPLGASHATRSKKSLSPVCSQQVSEAAGKGSTGCSQPALAPANGCIAAVSVQSKTVTAERHEQQCSTPADAATEVICIDDDDDCVLVVSDSPKADSSGSLPLTSEENNKPPPCRVLQAHEVLANEALASVITQSLATVCAEHLSTNLFNRGKTSGDGDEAVACITVDDTADNEQLPSTSEQVSSSCLSASASGVDEQQQASAAASSAASMHHSPRSKKIARLEKLLEVSLFV